MMPLWTYVYMRHSTSMNWLHNQLVAIFHLIMTTKMKIDFSVSLAADRMLYKMTEDLARYFGDDQ